MPHRACLACGYYNGRQVKKAEEVVQKAAEKPKTKKSAEEKSKEEKPKADKKK